MLTEIHYYILWVEQEALNLNATAIVLDLKQFHSTRFDRHLNRSGTCIEAASIKRKRTGI